MKRPLAIEADAYPPLVAEPLESIVGPRSGGLLQVFRRSIRPLVLAVLRAMPSPEGCGCGSRKRWLIARIEAI